MLKKPDNPNYCAVVTVIKKIVLLENCDNVCGSPMYGEQVIVSKDQKEGDVGLYFPPETQLSEEFLSNNNLYRHKEKNVDTDKAGYFEDNGRVRTVKFRQNKSVGFWIPLECLNFTGYDLSKLKAGDEFDTLGTVKICNKYIKKSNPKQQVNNARSRRRIRRLTKSRVIDNQFRFHEDTSQLGRNLHRIHQDSMISVTYKMHGTSLVSSKTLCKKNIGVFLRMLRALKVPVIDTEYFNLYASRKVIKNNIFIVGSKEHNHFYKEDIWKTGNDTIAWALEDGMTIYAEIVGHLSNGGFIQKPFDYGCDGHSCAVYIYRITYTNPAGRVFEFSAKQVQDWCKAKGLNAVPELYYGKVYQLFETLWIKHHGEQDSHEDKNKKIMQKYGCKAWNVDLFLKLLQEEYLEENCYMCRNKVPAEGIVVRIEQPDFEAYKLKSVRFLEFETKQLDKGEDDIEEMGEENG